MLKTSEIDDDIREKLSPSTPPLGGEMNELSKLSEWGVCGLLRYYLHNNIIFQLIKAIVASKLNIGPNLASIHLNRM